jgi:hypothetical protein
MSKTHIHKPRRGELIMLRKITLALATAAALGTAALAPTSASAWGGGFRGGWHGNSYGNYNSYNSYESYDSYDSYGSRGHDRRR